LINDFPKNYSEGKVFVCWEFLFIAALRFSQNNLLTRKKTRIFFTVECDNAKYIEQHSLFQSQNQILLSPTQFQFDVYLDPKYFYSLLLTQQKFVIKTKNHRTIIWKKKEKQRRTRNSNKNKMPRNNKNLT
jgi:hypothetical protein